MLISALIDSGATGQFIDIDYVWSENLHTQHLPRAIPVYSVDGNEVGYITEVIDLIVQYGDHSERATFHVTGISQTTIILRHMWWVEHNTEINWCTGKVSLTRFPKSCGPKATADLTDWLIPRLADNSSDSPKAKFFWKVHIEEVLEGHPEPQETELPPGFTHP